MSFDTIYERAYVAYKIENGLRNICVGLAMVSAVCHNVNFIIAFFLLGLVAQLHPVMTTYVKITTRNQTGFVKFLNEQAAQLDAELAELTELEAHPDGTMDQRQVESEIDARDHQVNFINHLH